MKLLKTTILTVLAASLLLYSAADAAKPRKLPESAYIKSAKISILSGDTARYREAIAMLDSLGLYYGPHAEALSLQSLIYVDFLEKESDFFQKPKWVELFKNYVDSLDWACANKDIKKDYRKDCDDYTKKADSTVVRFWRTYYNAGVSQLTHIGDLKQQLATATDSFTIDFAKKGIAAELDSCVTNFNMAIILDSADYRAYIAMGNAYQLRDESDKAIDWMKRALAIEGKPNPNLLNEIAYAYVQQDKYCEASEYFNQLVTMSPDDLDLSANLAICLNNCGLYDSALVINRMIVSKDSTDADAFSNIGRYFNQMARAASDSAGFYSEQEKPDKVKEWQNIRTGYFDSARVYFAQVFELSPEDEFAAQEYGMVSYLLSDFKASAAAFDRLTKLQPKEYDYWVTLGDSYIQLQDFKNAAVAYQAAVDIKPNDKDVLERLAELYKELKMPDKQAKIEKMLADR